MDSQKILYGNSYDECYTPDYAVEPLLKYIKPRWIVWCPFDTPDSAFVRVLSEHNVAVTFSHISTGHDFYNYEPPFDYDCIISNPPFSNKRKIFERALSFGKPVALLMSLAWLNDKYSKWVFKDAGRQMQLLMFDKRIHFIRDGVVSKKTTFSSGYYCSDFLPRDIVIETLTGA